MEKLYSYKMSHDNRFAPNPFFGVLTLATCKPVLRKCANVGDWIAGWTSRKIAHSPTPVGQEKLIYLAKVSEKLTFSEYWNKYPKKKATCTDDTNVIERYGDNIYKPVGENRFEQIKNINHDQSKMEKDLKGKYVLICKEFYYFSCLNPLTVPQDLRPNIPKGQHPTGALADNPEEFINFVRNHSDLCKYHKQ